MFVFSFYNFPVLSSRRLTRAQPLETFLLITTDTRLSSAQGASAAANLALGTLRRWDIIIIIITIIIIIINITIINIITIR